jgi:cysteine sulfinate desulfinase/cysteine desulfurase-like protein
MMVQTLPPAAQGLYSHRHFQAVIRGTERKALVSASAGNGRLSIIFPTP